MSLVDASASEWRWERLLRRPDTVAEDLGMIGESVGPRTGPNKRSHAEKEDYVLRRLLAAYRLAGGLPFPVTICAERERRGEPDFLLRWADGRTLGVEVTEAGSRAYQAWLTRTESGLATRAMPDEEAALSTARTVEELANAIARKNVEYEQGKYRSADACALVVYDNTHAGGFLDKRQLVAGLRTRNDLRGRFAAVHLVFESHVALDVFGSPELVDISRAYETDYVAWVAEQVERLRRGDADDLDRANIAEELEDSGKSVARSLASHLRVLLLHLLKLARQPGRSGRSWIYSIDNARAEIQDILSENPSLKRELPARIEQAYHRARKSAARETKLPLADFPPRCPFSAEQMLDDDFLPNGSEARDG
jgi:Domain of unknown function DUF29